MVILPTGDGGPGTRSSLETLIADGFSLTLFSHMTTLINIQTAGLKKTGIWSQISLHQPLCRLGPVHAGLGPVHAGSSRLSQQAGFSRQGLVLLDVVLLEPHGDPLRHLQVLLQAGLWAGGLKQRAMIGQGSQERTWHHQSVSVTWRVFRYLVGLHVPSGEVLDAVHEAVLRHLVVGPQELLELEHSCDVTKDRLRLSCVANEATCCNPPSPGQFASQRGAPCEPTSGV